MLQLLFLAHIALLVLPTSIAASGITNDSSVVSGKTFDYVIVGAGLAGTTIAARLAGPELVRLLVDKRDLKRAGLCLAYAHGLGVVHLECRGFFERERPQRARGRRRLAGGADRRAAVQYGAETAPRDE